MRSYILSVISVCLCCGMIRRLVNGKGASGAAIKAICGIAVVITVISPLVKMKYIDFQRLIQSVQIETDVFSQTAVDLTGQQMKTIISQKVRAYVLEKASSFDCKIASVDVELSDQSVPVPESLQIVGKFSPNIKAHLSDIIESSLGIPKENQKWIYQN